MKKLFTLGVLFFFLSHTQVFSQIVCNATFTSNVNGNNALFVPVNAAQGYTHVWSFGDGASSTLANPSHTYAVCGTYAVMHSVQYINPNGVFVCSDSTMSTINIVCTTPCSSQANFSTSYVNNQPNVILFTNTSTVSPNNSVVCNWYFGDGTTATAQSLSNQTHTYTASGVYNVCLIVSSGTPGTTNICRDTFCSTVQVQVNPAPCNLSPLVTVQNSPNQPNVFVFNCTNIPSPTPSIIWNFGDSTVGSGPVVTHTFANPGTYQVCMHITVNNTCSADTCVTVVVASTPTPCNLIAGFTAAPTSAVNTYAFTNTSTGFAAGDSIRWSFGDGSVAYDLNPTHTYSGPGTYQVCLWIRKNNTAAGTPPCQAYLCYGIVVGNPCNIQASFTTTPVANQPNTFVFTNTSITANAPAVSWNFGDSTTGTGSVVTHSFANPGTYWVCIRVAVSNTCYADTCITVTVNGTTPTPCNLNANFTWQNSPNAPNVFYFMNNSTGFTAGDSIRWNFGDGTNGFMINPVHTYAQPGTYNVCIRIAKPVAPGTAPCVSEICRTITVTTNPVAICDSINTYFNFAHDFYVPNKVYFYTISNMPVSQEQWTITPMNNTSGVVNINQYNPAYVFNATGDYLVCLSATTINGCVKNYCDTININTIASQCMLATYPNPATSQVSVNAVLSAPSSIYAYLFNSQNILLSQRVQTGVTGNNVLGFNISTLPAGYYTIRLFYNNQVCIARFQKL